MSKLIDCIPLTAFLLMVIAFNSYHVTILQNNDLDMKMIAIATLLMCVGMYFGKGGAVRNTGIAWCILGGIDYVFKELANLRNEIGINDYITLVLIIVAPFFVRVTQTNIQWKGKDIQQHP